MQSDRDERAPVPAREGGASCQQTRERDRGRTNFAPVLGLVLSHRAVDNAHDEMYSGVFGEAWAKAPDRELLSQAISEMQAFNPDKEEATYDRLVNGVLHAMCLLERFAPMPYEEDDDE
jgi:hypothetical protein